MIYISEKFMKVAELFRKNAFTKRGDSFYFVSIEEKEDTYLCVKLSNKSHQDRFEIETVKVLVQGENEDIEKESLVTDCDLKQNILSEFFRYLSYADNPETVLINESIIDIMKPYIFNGDFYSEGTALCEKFMHLFKIEGTVIQGYYEGNLVLTNVVLKNDATGQVIMTFDNINVTSNFYLEEEEEDEEAVKYMIENYLECLSEKDIKDIFTQLEIA